MPALIEKPHSFCFIVSEPEGPYRARDVGVIALNQSLLPGMVLGALVIGYLATSSATADAGNTGNGVLTLDPTAPVATSAKDGTYRVVFDAPTTFTVEDPTGKEIGKGSTGTAFTNDVKFVIATGGTAFAPGDAFGVTVGVESLKDQQFVALNPGASDGSEVPAAIACHAVTTDGTGTKRTTIWNGPGEVRASDLIWPSGMTAVQVAAAIEKLRARGIKLR